MGLSRFFAVLPVLACCTCSTFSRCSRREGKGGEGLMEGKSAVPPWPQCNVFWFLQLPSISREYRMCKICTLLFSVVQLVQILHKLVFESLLHTRQPARP